MSHTQARLKEDSLAAAPRVKEVSPGRRGARPAPPARCRFSAGCGSGGTRPPRRSRGTPACTACVRARRGGQAPLASRRAAANARQRAAPAPQRVDQRAHAPAVVLASVLPKALAEHLRWKGDGGRAHAASARWPGGSRAGTPCCAVSLLLMLVESWWCACALRLLLGRFSPSATLDALAGSPWDARTRASGAAMLRHATDLGLRVCRLLRRRLLLQGPLLLLVLGGLPASRRGLGRHAAGWVRARGCAHRRCCCSLGRRCRVCGVGVPHAQRPKRGRTKERGSSKADNCPAQAEVLQQGVAAAPGGPGRVNIREAAPHGAGPWQAMSCIPS